tara:strand:+ start:4549 stop:6084 length:1536 start_codon:yes stop_codon:yes gene_type:complete
MKLTKILNSAVLLEGRIEDVKQYFEKSVGSWPVAEPGNPAGIGSETNLDGVLKHFVQNDPSGNNKYLMWMVKMYLNPEERGTSPNDISSLVQRFNNNVTRLTPALMMDLGFANPRIVTSPKNIDSYEDLAQLERVMDEIDSIKTKKERDNSAKAGVDKLFEDDRWLLVKPNTHEGSCYYGSSTKWCTASTEETQHFDNYTKTGILFYIIDKSKDVGDFFKIALHKKWSGEEEWYDRADNELKQETEEAIRSLLPAGLVNELEKGFELVGSKRNRLLTLDEFRERLTEFMKNHKNLQTISSASGEWVWDLEVDVWTWTSTTNDAIFVQATPFWEGQNSIPFDSFSDEDVYGEGFTYIGATENDSVPQEQYLKPNIEGRFGSEDWGVRIFLRMIYLPLLRSVLDEDYFTGAVGEEYSTWSPNSYVSTFKFKYPPREGTMTQKFVDYLTNNPRKTSNQFYEEVLGYPRPRAHNNMFFSSIKDSGIVKMERQGRQFVYSLGPNYLAWKEGKLLRI